jgi:hypothetical protein
MGNTARARLQANLVNSPLLRLPPELRNCIYELVLSGTYGYIEFPIFVPGPDQHRPPTLLQVSSTIRQETLPIWYGNQRIRADIHLRAVSRLGRILHACFSLTLNLSRNPRMTNRMWRHFTAIEGHARLLQVRFRWVEHACVYSVLVEYDRRCSGERIEMSKLPFCVDCGSKRCGACRRDKRALAEVVRALEWLDLRPPEQLQGLLKSC